MKTFIITAFIFICSFTFSQSPYTNIQLNTGGSPEEPSICINPKNINQLVAGANIDRYYYSTNGGSTWTQGTLLNSTWGVWGDPIIVCDTNQNFYYFHLSNATSPNGYWIDRIIAQKSTNAGISWSNPGSYTYYNPPRAQQDKEGVVVDFTHGSRGGWMYCTWTQFDSYNSAVSTDSSRILFARSTDGGLTWVGVTRLDKVGGDCRDMDFTVEGAVPAVGPNGEIYVGWAGPQPPNSFKIFFDKSTDGGNTWLINDIVAANQRGGWDYVVAGIYRNNGLPATCCDLSNGPYRGTIYINYTDSAGPADHDVMVVKSTNGGTTWSSPIRVNDDPAGKEQFFSWMTIDMATGYVYIVYYDRRNYSNTQTDVFLAKSSDGGTTWINERISSSPFTPTSGTFFGDYNGITAHNGRVRPIWTRLVSGTLSVWTALIDFPTSITQTNSEIPGEFALYQNYPNPFNPATKIKFDIPAGSNMNITQIKVYDLLGKEVATIVNEQLAPGTYEYEWDASNLSSGVYFYTLKSGGFEQTKKLVLGK